MDVSICADLINWIQLEKSILIKSLIVDFLDAFASSQMRSQMPTGLHEEAPLNGD